MSQYLYRAKTKEAFVLKIIGEHLSNAMKYPPLSVNETGMFLRATDTNREILVDLNLPRENFTVFKCPKPLHFIVNSSHFYKLLKSIKKKDSVTLFILEKRPMELGICVEQNDENNKVTTFIKITYIQPEEIDLPDGYGQPLIITSKEFQKLKNLHSIGNEMKITISNNIIKFYCDGRNLFSREIVIGNEDEEDEEGTDEKRVYFQTFNTQHITQLTKCAGQSGNVQIYYHDELPIQIKMRTGTLGSLTVYVKSKELIEFIEQEQDDDKKEEDDDEAEQSADEEDEEIPEPPKPVPKKRAKKVVSE